MDEDESFFDRFWEASKLDKFNVKQFAQQLNNYDSENKELVLEFPGKIETLPKTRSQLNKIAARRQSSRTFSGQAMTLKELSLLLSSFRAWNGLEHRSYPSAGATYVTEIFCTVFNVESYSGKTLYYDQDKHGVVVVPTKSPTWTEAGKTLNMEIKGTPNLLLTFMMFPDRAISKYGERGGRFALLEVGAALQQLCLQIAESRNLKGVAVGGMLDNFWQQSLGLADSQAHITVGYLIGK